MKVIASSPVNRSFVGPDKIAFKVAVAGWDMTRTLRIVLDADDDAATMRRRYREAIMAQLGDVDELVLEDEIFGPQQVIQRVPDPVTITKTTETVQVIPPRVWGALAALSFVTGTLGVLLGVLIG